MEKEKVLVNIGGRAPMTSLRSSPSNSNSNSMDYYTHTQNQVSMGLGDLNCFLNLNWDNSMMGVDHDSALSSMVSSPLAPPQQTPNSTTPTTTTNNNNNNSNFVIRELIGRLGGICNSGEAQFNSHSNSSILELDPNPPHNPSLDQGFYERAARYSQFNSIPTATTGKLSRVSSNQSLKAASGAVVDNRKLLSRSCTPDNAELDESSASEPKNVNSTRKRKATTTTSKPKSKETTIPSSAKDSKVTAKNEDESNAKRSKTTETEKAEPPKDYIHVRARRGQATDSHSLAERVRREKISERMKFLQDLVPGCNKVTGKAVMLDEIINYVQSLQRQVEFLSMKLATVNPRMEVNMETLFSKEILQSHGSSAHPIHPTDSMGSAFPYGHHHQSLQSSISNGMDTHCSVNPLDVAAQRLNLSMQLPSLDGYVDNDAQLAAFWGDDLQSIVQMGFGQNQSGGETAFQTQSFHGSLPTSHMKVEL